VDVSQVRALDLASRLSSMKLAAAIFTDISKDGMLQGPAVESTRRFAEAAGLPVIASGGVGSLEDVRALSQLPIHGIIIGRALYTGDVALPEAIRAARGE